MKTPKEGRSGGCAPMPGSLVPVPRVYMSSRPGSGKSLCARIALNPQIMMITGGGDVNLLKDGGRRFLMVDLDVKSPENDQVDLTGDAGGPNSKKDVVAG